jgi:exonuclease SbcC
MITKVILKNWRSHLNSELNFSSGTNALLGHLGSGKSSVLDSICFAFFGTTPTLQSKKLKLDDVIMKKPSAKDRAEVEVHFQLNGTTYSVKRMIEKGKGTMYSEIRENGKLIESPSTSRVTELVEKILKVNYDLFSKAIYSEQNALDYFLTIPKGQRMKKIDELLMIDKFEKGRANVVVLTNKIAERKLGKQSIIEQLDFDFLQKNISDLENTLDSTLKEKNLIQKNLEEVTVQKITLEKEVEELRKIKNQLETFKREERGSSSAIYETSLVLEVLQRKLKGLDLASVEKDYENTTNLVKNLEQALEEKREEYQKLQEQFAKAKAEVETLEKNELKRLEKDFNDKLRIKDDIEKLNKAWGEDLDKQIEDKEKSLRKIVGEIEATKIKISDLQETLKELSSATGKCPTCESRLTEEKKKSLVKQKKIQLQTLEKTLDSIEEKKKLTEGEQKELRNAIEKLNRMLVGIENFNDIKINLETSRNILLVLKESYVKLSKELTESEKELRNLEKRYKETTENKQKFEITLLQAREYTEKKNRMETLTRERATILKNIEELEKRISGKEVEKEENLLRNLIAKEREFATKLVGMDQITKEKETRLNDLKKTYETALKDKEEIKKLDKLVQELKVFEKSLEETQIELRKEFVTTVNYTMNNLWPTLYPYQDFVGIRLSIEEGDYVLQLQERSGAFVNVEGVASGGERSIAVLALRIAFSLILAPQMRILVLDEPTVNLDEKAVEDLAETLRERIGEYIEQLFIISHDSKLEEAITGYAYRLEREKEKDGPTKVIQIT